MAPIVENPAHRVESPGTRRTDALMNPQTRFSDAFVEDFRRDGFALVPGLCPQPLLRAMRAAAQADLAAGRGPLERESEVGYPGAPAGPDAPGGHTVRRLLGALDREESFRAWATSPEVTRSTRSLLGTDDIRVVRAHHNCIMTKHPRYSSATGWHQDIRYWSFASGELVNVWTALGREAGDNGGMCLIPGSHRMALGAERFDSERFFRTDLDINRPLIDSAIQVALAAGDVLFFHAGILHAAGRNTTRVRKLSVVFSYRSADNHPVPGSRSGSVPDLDPGESRP